MIIDNWYMIITTIWGDVWDNWTAGNLQKRVTCSVETLLFLHTSLFINHQHTPSGTSLGSQGSLSWKFRILTHIVAETLQRTVIIFSDAELENEWKISYDPPQLVVQFYTVSFDEVRNITAWEWPRLFEATIK